MKAVLLFYMMWYFAAQVAGIDNNGDIVFHSSGQLILPRSDVASSSRPPPPSSSLRRSWSSSSSGSDGSSESSGLSTSSSSSSLNRLERQAVRKYATIYKGSQRKLPGLGTPAQPFVNRPAVRKRVTRPRQAIIKSSRNQPIAPIPKSPQRPPSLVSGKATVIGPGRLDGSNTAESLKLNVETGESERLKTKDADYISAGGFTDGGILHAKSKGNRITMQLETFSNGAGYFEDERSKVPYKSSALRIQAIGPNERISRTFEGTTEGKAKARFMLTGHAVGKFYTTADNTRGKS